MTSSWESCASSLDPFLVIGSSVAWLGTIDSSLVGFWLAAEDGTGLTHSGFSIRGLLTSTSLTSRLDCGTASWSMATALPFIGTADIGVGSCDGVRSLCWSCLEPRTPGLGVVLGAL